MFVILKINSIFVSKLNHMKKKQSISPTLKKLELYEKIEYPLSRYSVVGATINRFHTETKMRFTQKKLMSTFEVIRTA